MKKRAVQIELVYWDDAHGSSSPGENADPLAGYITHSVGWLVAEDDKYLKIAMDTWPEAPDDHHTATTIPKSLVIKRVVLAQPKRKKK